jgi:hypothetical protein
MTTLPMAPTSGDREADGPARDRAPAGRAVRSGVLAALGHPPGLYDVAVRPLWADRYRVNVLVGPDPTAVRIAHSFFVEARDDGTILSATPRITRSYP